MRLKDVCVALAAGFKLYGGGSSSIVAFCLKKMCFVASVAGWAKYFPISHFLVARARPRTYCTSKTPSSHFITFQPSPGGPQAINGMCTLYYRRIKKTIIEFFSSVFTMQKLISLLTSLLMPISVLLTQVIKLLYHSKLQVIFLSGINFKRSSNVQEMFIAPI